MNKYSKNTVWKIYKPICLGATALKLVAIPLELATAELLSRVSTAAVEGRLPEALSASAAALALLLLSLALHSGAGIALQKKRSQAENQSRLSFLNRLLENSPEKLFRADPGELNENLNDDLDALRKRYLELLPTAIASGAAIALYVWFLSRQSGLAALTLLGISLIQLLPPLLVKRFMQVSYDECRDMEAQITDHVLEAVNGFEVIQSFDLKDWWLKKLADYHRNYLRVGNKSEAVFTAQLSLFRATDNILKFGTYGLMGVYVILGFCGLGGAVKAIYLSGDLFPAVKALFSTIPDFSVAKSAQQRLEKWTGNAPTETEAPIEGPADIALSHVRYATEEKTILRDGNWRFDSEKTYLIQGANGAGKTTLLNLLTGLVLPDGGEIRGSEKDLLYIPQNDPEFGFPARELFAMFPDAENLAMLRTAEPFGLDAEALDTPIGELSGGQRKKVFLSLGFGLRPKWLLLDEPTNSLDEAGREALLALLQTRRGVLLVSHDPALEKLQAEVLTLREGVLAYEAD